MYETSTDLTFPNSRQRHSHRWQAKDEPQPRHISEASQQGEEVVDGENVEGRVAVIRPASGKEPGDDESRIAWTPLQRSTQHGDFSFALVHETASSELIRRRFDITTVQSVPCQCLDNALTDNHVLRAESCLELSIDFIRYKSVEATASMPFAFGMKEKSALIEWYKSSTYLWPRWFRRPPLEFN
jgi:hypothetical protein